MHAGGESMAGEQGTDPNVDKNRAVEARLDAVIVPVSGGGLISGIATAVKGCAPNCKVQHPLLCPYERAGAPTYSSWLQAW